MDECLDNQREAKKEMAKVGSLVVYVASHSVLQCGVMWYDAILIGESTNSVMVKVRDARKNSTVCLCARVRQCAPDAE
jgi:hypothetical protein